MPPSARAGAEARFMKTGRVLTRPAVLVLDDFGMRELTAAQADDLYELITERDG
ncbi:ATP-binding protein [Nonomuraea sp. CA-141351]|uniref:ATP-binding protein n=1 Tax=Nonomuraea sp. CA-141351 TaxID=3239996 RepID=UPI003D93426D